MQRFDKRVCRSSALFSCLFLGWAGSSYGSNIDWEKATNIPGVEFYFTKSQEEEGFYYLHTASFPSDKKYALWRRLVDGSEALVAKNLYANQSSELESREIGPLSQELFIFDTIPGEPVQFAVIAKDGSMVAAAKVIPNPLHAKGDGGCSLSMELVAHNPIMFRLTGSGFQPNEELETLSVSGPEKMSGKQQASAKGDMASMVMPEVKGLNRSVASFQVSSPQCSVKLDYEWIKKK